MNGNWVPMHTKYWRSVPYRRQYATNSFKHSTVTLSNETKTIWVKFHNYGVANTWLDLQSPFWKTCTVVPVVTDALSPGIYSIDFLFWTYVFPACCNCPRLELFDVSWWMCLFFMEINWNWTYLIYGTGGSGLSTLVLGIPLSSTATVLTLKSL